MPGMTAHTTTPLQSKFGPIVADAAGTITVQEASDVLEYSRFRVCELLNANAGRVLVTDVLELEILGAAYCAPGSPRCQARRLKEHADDAREKSCSCESQHRGEHALTSATETTKGASTPIEPPYYSSDIQ